jgi:hypothetical protein
MAEPLTEACLSKMTAVLFVEIDEALLLDSDDLFYTRLPGLLAQRIDTPVLTLKHLYVTPDTTATLDAITPDALDYHAHAVDTRGEPCLNPLCPEHGVAMGEAGVYVQPTNSNDALPN